MEPCTLHGKPIIEPHSTLKRNPIPKAYSTLKRNPHLKPINTPKRNPILEPYSTLQRKPIIEPYYSTPSGRLLSTDMQSGTSQSAARSPATAPPTCQRLYKEALLIRLLGRGSWGLGIRIGFWGIYCITIGPPIVTEATLRN